MKPRHGSWLMANGYGRWSVHPSSPSAISHLLVTPLSRMHFLEHQRLLVELRLVADALELPRRHVRIVVVVAHRFAFGRLALFSEVSAGRFPAVERVD